MKKTADFATKADFPEANDVLGAGNNENTVDLAIFRAEGLIVSKMLLDDEDIAKLTANRCFYLCYKAVTHPPVMVYTDSPFMNAEERGMELAKDIETVNNRLRALNDLTRVTKKITGLEVIQLNVRHERNLFEGVPYLEARIKENSEREFHKG